TADSGFFVSDDDRVVPPSRKAKKPIRKASSAARRRPESPRGRRARSRARRGGFFGLMRTTVYWGMVLCLWAGIAGIGLVAFYGAKMPAATTWAIPDRPPNVRIIAVNGQLL